MKQENVTLLEEAIPRIDMWPPLSPSGPKDFAESLRMARVIRAGVKQCWFNAQSAVMRLPDYSQAGYVEGWAHLSPQ